MRDSVILHNFGLHRKAILDIDRRQAGNEVRIRIHEDMIKGWCAVPWLLLRSIFWPGSIENEIRRRWLKYAEEAEQAAGVSVPDVPAPDEQTDAAVRAALLAASKAPEAPKTGQGGEVGPEAPELH